MVAKGRATFHKLHGDENKARWKRPSTSTASTTEETMQPPSGASDETSEFQARDQKRYGFVNLTSIDPSALSSASAMTRCSSGPVRPSSASCMMEISCSGVRNPYSKQ